MTIQRNYVALISVALLSCVACDKLNYNFTGLEIDPAMKVKMSGVAMSQPTSGQYYFKFQSGAVTGIHHFDKEHASEPAVRMLYLEVDPQHNLVRTVKHDVILAGTFGYVYAERDCYYQKPQSGYANSVSVGDYKNTVDEESPAVLSSKPKDIPALTSLSLIRVFSAGSDHTIVSANYEADGSLGSVHVDHTTAGVWTKGENDAIPKDPTPESLQAAGFAPDLLTKYGIPAKIDVAAYLKDKKIDMPEVTMPEERQVLDVFYGWDKVIRQDELRAGVVTDTAYEQPTVTKEEETLNPVCEANFAAQQAQGRPTVQ